MYEIPPTKESQNGGNKNSTYHSRLVVYTLIPLAIIIFTIYANSLRGSWQFDDLPNITNNPRLHLSKLSWHGIKTALFSDQRNPGLPYRPLACLSFAFNYYFGGLDVYGYHLINVLIHLTASIFLFLFIYHTLNLPSMQGKYAEKSYFIAILSTMLWALNPMQTQAVSYIVQRMASLAGMFYIMGLYFFLKARTVERKGRISFFMVLCFLSFVMAFGSKENAVLLPMSLLLYEVLVIQEETGKFVKNHIKSLILVLGVTLLLGLIFLALKGDTILSFLSGYNERPFSMMERLLTESRVLVYYLSLLFFPVSSRLSVAHSIEISTSFLNPIGTLFSMIFVVGAIVVLILYSKRHPLFSFCFLFFLLNHLIESSIFPLELIYEHRNYVPSMFLFVPFAIGLINLQKRYFMNRPMKTFITAIMIFILAGFGYTTFKRNSVWKSRKSLWMDAVKKAPDQMRVHHNMGLYYQDHGYREEALSQFEKALNSTVIHRKDESILSLYQLGQLYYDFGDFERAKSYYQKALAIRPKFPYALVNLASIYNKKGDPKRAYQYLQRAFKSNPGNPAVNLNLGLHHLKHGRPNAALSHLMVSLNDEGLKGKTFLYIGLAYKQKGQLSRAVGEFRKSIATDEKNITPHLHLAEIYQRTGHVTKRRQEIETIIEAMLQSEDLFYRTIDLISQQGHMGHIQLSSDLLLPLIYEACNAKSERMNEWRDYIEKILEK